MCVSDVDVSAEMEAVIEAAKDRKRKLKKARQSSCR